MDMRIVINNGDGTVSILTPITSNYKKDIPKDKKYRVADVGDLPGDRIFREAWTDDVSTDTVNVDIARAKEICHTIRRKNRDKLMAPLDIKATIPTESKEVEIDRRKIREENAKLQVDIEKANNADKLKDLIKEII